VRRDKYFFTECEAEHPRALPRVVLRLHRLLRPLPRAALRALAAYAVRLCAWAEDRVDAEALCWNCDAGDRLRVQSVERCARWLPEAAALLEAVRWPAWLLRGAPPAGRARSVEWSRAPLDVRPIGGTRQLRALGTHRCSYRRGRAA